MSYEESIDGLRSDDPEVRRRALMDLSGLQIVPVDNDLLHQIESRLFDNDLVVASNAAFALGKLGNKESVLPLTAVLRTRVSRDDNFARQVLIAIFDVTGGDDASLLEPGLESPVADVRITAADLISHSSDKNAADLLLRRLQIESDPAVSDVLTQNLRDMGY